MNKGTWERSESAGDLKGSAVSVIIPSYNRYDTLVLAVKSVLEQTYPVKEILVVNDGSTDPRYQELENVTLINLEPGTQTLLGFPCAGYVRNQGIKKATGDWIAFLDDDDYWLPNKLEKQMKALDQYQVNICSSDALTDVGPYNLEKKYEKKLLNKNQDTVFDLSFIKRVNYIITSTIVIHRSVIEKAGYFPEIPLYGRGGKYEDYEYWKECLKHSSGVFLKEPLIYYDRTVHN